MPKVYAYLRKVPIQRQYLVSYPYGVGGNTLLDQLLGNINFDNWLVTSILSYFSARFILTPFGVPSLLGLAQQAFTAITGRSSSNSVSDRLLIKAVSDYLGENNKTFSPNVDHSRLKRSENNMELVNTVSNEISRLSQSRIGDYEDSLYVPINSVLSVATVIGMATMLQNILSEQKHKVINNDQGRSVSNGHFHDVNNILGKKKKRRKRRRKHPKNHQNSSRHQIKVPKNQIYFSQNISPYNTDDVHVNGYSYKDFEDEDNKNPDYFVDFYEDKNYEYIDQDDSESMSFDELDANLFKMKFDFNNIDYDNYEYEEVGVLNFREPVQFQSEKPVKSDKKIGEFVNSGHFDNVLSKRKVPLRQESNNFYFQPLHHEMKHRRLKPTRLQRTESALDGFQSSVDLSSLLTIGGLWLIWQVYLSGSGLIPSTSLNELWNNIGNYGREDNSLDSEILEILSKKSIESYSSRQKQS